MSIECSYYYFLMMLRFTLLLVNIINHALSSKIAATLVESDLC